jgi:hypothetical protein
VSIDFKINFPLEETCYVKIQFPREVMININDDLDTYTGTYIFEDGGDRTSFTKKAYS